MREYLTRAFAALALGTLLVSAQAGAQDMDVPVSVQIPLFLKVLSFDRQLPSRVTGEVVVVIAYQSVLPASVKARDEAASAVAAASGILDGYRLRTVSVDISRNDLAAALRNEKAALLYITPLRGVDVADIARTASERRVTSASGVTRFAQGGVAVCVRLQGDRPKLLINLTQAKGEGADFSAELLKLAQVSK